jgi:hypothetical protein
MILSENDMKGGEMVHAHQEGIEEVFLFKTKEVDFFGVLVKEKGGRSTANGRIKFPDGTRWYFNHPPGDRDDLVEKMEALTVTIAGYYGANVSRFKFARVMGYDEFTRVLRMGRGGMN